MYLGNQSLIRVNPGIGARGAVRGRQRLHAHAGNISMRPYVRPGLCLQEAVRKLEHEAQPGDGSGFMRMRRPIFGQRMCLLAVQKPGQANVFSITRPNTGGTDGVKRGQVGPKRSWGDENGQGGTEMNCSMTRWALLAAGSIQVQRTNPIL